MAVQIKESKLIKDVKKGDKVKVDGKEYEVDAHYVMIDHGSTKEMVIEIFDSKLKDNEEDYQIRYFDDQVGETVSFYKLESIVYKPQEIKKIEW